MRRTLTDAEYREQFAYKRGARRVELQPQYWVSGERASFEWFLAGKPEPFPEIEGMRAWLDNAAKRKTAGISVERIRVHQDPPTDYQRWLRLLDPPYLAAGDRIDYLTTRQADMAGLLGVAARDWWFFDDERLVVMTHDEEGRKIRSELITDEPELNRARAWWDLAVHTTRGENT